MKKKIFKFVTLILAPLFILVCMTCLQTRKIPSKVYLSTSREVTAFANSLGPLGTMSKNQGGYEISILGVIPVKNIEVLKVNNLEVVAGGTPVGVRITSEGVLVVGHSEVIVNEERTDNPGKNADIRIGDVILTFNGEKIKSSKDLLKKVKSAKSENAVLEIERNSEVIKKEVILVKEKDEDYKLGLWVRDSTAGVGTMTFYEKKSGKYGALGHPITDSDTNKIFEVKDGELLNSSIISVKKGERGMPGELKGIFLDEKSPVGTIVKNTECGIFGKINGMYKEEGTTYKVGFRDEIKEGKAKIITTVDENGPREYDIEISKLLPQDKSGPKSMIIKVIDPELLEKTGGIVQGMSGSPIIQNNKIVGAVTHVLINKPDTGYGIYIEWMLQDAEVIK